MLPDECGGNHIYSCPQAKLAWSFSFSITQKLKKKESIRRRTPEKAAKIIERFKSKLVGAEGVLSANGALALLMETHSPG